MWIKGKSYARRLRRRVRRTSRLAALLLSSKGPVGVATAAAGAGYVADYGNHRIQKFGSVPTPTNATTWGRLKSLYR